MRSNASARRREMRSFERVSAGYQRHLDAVVGGCAVYVDKIIAGIADARDLMIVTRNTKHFAPFGVGVATPDEAVRFN